MSDIDRIKELEARLARVTEPHFERDWRPLDGTYLGGTICNQCRRDWPCQVIRAVAADEQEAGR